jgi:hypothetical protein
VRAGPASFAERPPPAAGLTMAKNRSIGGVNESEMLTPAFQAIVKRFSQGQNRGSAVQHRETLCQHVAFDLERSRSGKVLIEQNDPVDTLVV